MTLNPWLLGGLALAAIGAVSLAVYASGPGYVCPTEDQKKKAFADVTSGSLSATSSPSVADVASVWEKCGLKAEAEALRFAAKYPGVSAPPPEPPALPPPVSTTPIPGTNIAIPKSFPASLAGGPAYTCAFESGSRDFAVMVVMNASNDPANHTDAYADIMQRFAEQLAYCGDMSNAEKVGKRSEAIRPKVAGVTGYAKRDRCAPPHIVAARAHRRAA